MHRSSQCSRTRCIPRLGRTVYGRHSRPFTNASARYVVDNDGQEKEDLFSWEEHHAEEVGRRPGDTQGVITSDLPATLEAHRARNRASVIRRIDAPSKTPRSIHRPPIETSHNDGKGSSGPPTRSRALSSNDGKGNVKSIKVKQKLEEAKASMPMWPADSTQFITRYGDGKKKGIRMTRTGKYVKSNEVLEYTGTPLSPNRSWSWRANVAPLLQRPWLAYMEESSGDKTKRLSEEIKAYELYMRLTPAEEKAAQSVISDITSITRDHLGDTPLVLLGSRSTGLATPLSDFDLTFPAMPSMDVSAESILIGDRQKLKSQALSSLRKIQQSLHRSVRLKGTEVVTARVPILETQHQATGLRIQIQTMAPYQPAQEYTVAYLNEMPSIRPLYIILRYFLEIRDLTTVYEGGLGSYSLLMMIVTALKHSSGTFATDDLGGQLLYILHFYGSADLYRFGFSANPPRMFDKISKGCSMAERLNRSKDPQLRGIDEIVRNQNSRKPYLLSLQDPANDSNDLGKNAYAIKHIQATFIKARESIVNSLQRRGDFAKAETWSCLDYLVRADYTAFEAKRSRVERSTNRQMPRDRDYSLYRVQEDFLRRVEFRDEEGMKSADGGKTYRKVDHIEAKSTHSEPLSQPRITTHYLTCSFSKHRVR